jgi:hypothetical protein
MKLWDARYIQTCLHLDQHSQKTITHFKLKPMNAFLRKSLGFAMLFLTNKEILAQIDLGKYEIGLTGGVFIYQGDLTPSRFGSFTTLKPAVNLFVNRIMNSSFSLRSSLFYGTLRGDDATYSHPAWRQQRNFNFHSPVLEFSELLVWNAWSTNRKLTPYLFGGVGLSFLNIQRDWSRFNGEFFVLENLSSRLIEDMAHKTPRLIPVLPVGAGVRYAVSKKFAAIAETSYRFTRTDYLDGFSKAANAEFYDHYQSITVGAVYTFGKKSALNCPTIAQ